jgi:hypothetical protein
MTPAEARAILVAYKVYLSRAPESYQDMIPISGEGEHLPGMTPSTSNTVYMPEPAYSQAKTAFLSLARAAKIDDRFKTLAPTGVTVLGMQTRIFALLKEADPILGLVPKSGGFGPLLFLGIGTLAILTIVVVARKS